MKKVMVFGTFDILHPGHIDFLKQAKKYGDFLIVSLAREQNVRKFKGHGPLHTERERRKLLESLKFVDKVVLGSKRNYLAQIIKQKPEVIALGYDQKYFTKGLEKKLAEHGLWVKIVRLKSYFPRRYKTQKILKSIF